jgi:hypothetical protein
MIKENQISNIKNKKYGIKLFLLRVFSFLCSSSKLKSTSDDLKKMDFPASAQRVGITFTDKIRNAFRHKWVKRVD